MLHARGKLVADALPWPAQGAAGEHNEMRSAAHEEVCVNKEEDWSCVVRRMTSEDIEAVLGVESISFVEPYSRSAFLHLLGLHTSISYVGTQGTRFAGYLILDVGAAVTKGRAYVVSVAVLPTCRGCGMAAMMLRAALHDAATAGAVCVELHVHSLNKGAQRVYERCGFEVAGEEGGYYGLEDELQRGDA